MVQSSSRRRILGSVLLVLAIVLAIVLYVAIGTHALLAGAAPLLILAIISVLLLAGWPWQAKK
ncbi:MAG: hypothetical protein JO215_06245 [Ktedonobacteraceae bacterium]|nr:hypothetical protein [Ktedonobacteraceae bacterium]MBV9614921.1 hypothetical protein [Ktedonobacteraceae bacterium]MBV9709385.1 hypothetical protein [Ktedonobacteraceae bacterium]